MNRVAPLQRPIISPISFDPEEWDEQETAGLRRNDAMRAFLHFEGLGIPLSSRERLGDKGSFPSPSGRGARGEGLRTATFAHAQKGAALIIGLLFLLVVILVSISGLHTVALEEKMAAAAYDRNLAFQAAEAALRVGEARARQQALAGNTGFPSYTDADDSCPSHAINNCTDGLCPEPDKDCLPRWKSPGFTGWTDVGNIDLGNLVEAAPQYFIESLTDSPFTCYPNNNSAECRDCCYRYRITARSNPAAGRATVVLQSIYVAVVY